MQTIKINTHGSALVNLLKPTHVLKLNETIDKTGMNSNSRLRIYHRNTSDEQSYSRNAPMNAPTPEER